jgi:hypothetical protein
MYVVLAEGKSDFNCLKILIKRLEKYKWIEEKKKEWKDKEKNKWTEINKDKWFNKKEFERYISEPLSIYESEELKNYHDIVLVEGKGFGCCGDMKNKGSDLLKSYNKQDKFCKFIVCHDRDEKSYQDIYDIASKIANDAKLNPEKLICILIPTVEIEAWILADVKAVSNVISSWQPENNYLNPEDIQNPKETLIRLSRINKPRPLYSHNKDNENVMKYLDLAIVKKKCPSFAELANFVENDIANYPIRKSK